MSEEAVVVEIELGIERQQLALACDDHWIDLGQRTVLVQEGAIQALHQANGLRQLLWHDMQGIRQASGFKGEQAEQWIDPFLEDFFGRTRRHLFDGHTTRFAGDHYSAILVAIHRHTHIQLTRDIQGFLNQHLTYETPLGAGLWCHQRHAENLRPDLCRLRGGGSELDATPQTAATSMNLRLD